MAIPLFLAQTSAEFHASQKLPGAVAWMACHFSPWGSGLSNLPPALPEGSLLILDDRIPPSGHDPERITQQLLEAMKAMSFEGVLLDFQRPHCDEIPALVAHLTASLPCPVVVSDLYAKDPDCPVFLSPCPHHVALEDHFAPWNGRRVWLDLAVDAETITVTKTGSRIFPMPLGEIPKGGHGDRLLSCHYAMETGSESVRFTLWRTVEDLAALAKAAEGLGAEALVGLYCELGVWSGE